MRKILFLTLCFFLCPSSIAASPPDIKEAKSLQTCLSKVNQIVALAASDISDSVLDGKISTTLAGQSNRDLLLVGLILNKIRLRQEAATCGVEKVVDRAFWASARRIAISKKKDASDILDQLKAEISPDGAASLKFKNLERLSRGQPENW